MKTHYAALLIIGMACSFSATAKTVKFKVIAPDNEEKVYILEDTFLEVKLPKSKWKCLVDQDKPGFTQKDATARSVHLACRPPKSTDITTASAACGDKTDMPALVTIMEKHTGQGYRIIIYCE